MVDELIIFFVDLRFYGFMVYGYGLLLMVCGLWFVVCGLWIWPH